MKTQIARIFDSEKIEYKEVLAFSDVVTTKSHLLTSLGFEPKSVILFLLPYYTGDGENISRYAVSLDYHLGIREVGERIVKDLSRIFPDGRFSVFGDHSPIDERHAALTAGLGILGDNGLLLNREYGSYVFIADILTDVPPEKLGRTDKKTVAFCEHCGQCKNHCPTGILRGMSDACLSAITQKKGDLGVDEIALMKRFNTVWGCDECQCHCPHNQNPKPTPIPFFFRERLTELSGGVLAAMDDETFARRAYAWRGRKVVERNVALLEKNK